ncbi:MAG: 3-dehydroquinate synthase [Actinomycetales bacterium]
MLTTIPVAGSQPYDVLVGPAAVDRLAASVGDQARQVFLVHAGEPTHLIAQAVRELGGAGYLVNELPVPAGEAAKTGAVAQQLWAALGKAEATRSDTVVGIGGGAVTDLAGFVAATWLRGVRLVQVPTTLLGMVDAAVGGKTGINTAEGKNLVGAFYPPAAVLCDLHSLDSLPAVDLRAGLAEVVKCGFIADPAILDLIESAPEAVLSPGSDQQREVIERAIAVKAAVVGEDLTESWLREILNYGHTLAHAIELVEGYTWRHGEAVSVGLVFAAELAQRTGHLDSAMVQRHRDVLDLLGLPTGYQGGRWEDLLTGMRRDKKARGDRLRFVVLDDVGAPTRLEGPDLDVVRDAFEAVSG